MTVLKLPKYSAVTLYFALFVPSIVVYYVCSVAASVTAMILGDKVFVLPPLSIERLQIHFISVYR